MQLVSADHLVKLLAKNTTVAYVSQLPDQVETAL
jgi:hypothetical protein